MTQEEAEHSLRVLVELDLYEKIKSDREVRFQTREARVKSAEGKIQDFEEKLPEWAKQIPNYHGIIIDTLKRTQNAMQKINNKDTKPKSLGEER